jgi:hypothetical protein
MVIQNLVSNGTYRSAVGLFNITGDLLTIEMSLKNSGDALIGSSFTKIVGSHEFLSFNPFSEAGVPYPGDIYDNTYLLINPVTGTGEVICFGATSNNFTNDPAAHLAVQKDTGWENSPSGNQIIPEAVWAPASGGGTWQTEIQITDFSGESGVFVYFSPLGENLRGPIALWTGPGNHHSVKYSNILETLNTLDPEFDYNGKIGSLEFVTQDSSHVIHVTARTLNGNTSKAFQGLNNFDVNTAAVGRRMMIQNFSSSSDYRSAVGVVNLKGDLVIVEFSLRDSDGDVIGSPFTKTLSGHEFLSFNPFAEAGEPYPLVTHDNVWLYINPTTGSGEIMCFGATSSNTSNDPAAHLAVQYK